MRTARVSRIWIDTSSPLRWRRGMRGHAPPLERPSPFTRPSPPHGGEGEKLGEGGGGEGDRGGLEWGRREEARYPGPGLPPAPGPRPPPAGRAVHGKPLEKPPPPLRPPRRPTRGVGRRHRLHFALEAETRDSP